MCRHTRSPNMRELMGKTIQLFEVVYFLKNNRSIQFKLCFAQVGCDWNVNCNTLENVFLERRG